MAGSGSSRMVARNFNRKHGTALEGHGVAGKDTGHKSSHGTYYHRHDRHNFTCANACSSTVENTYQYVYSKQW